MVFRTSAVYQRSQTIVVTCLFLYVAEIASMSAILAASASVLDATHSDPSPDVPICTPQHVLNYYHWVWIPAIIFDCALCTSSFLACLRHVKGRGALCTRRQMWDVLLTATLLYFSATLTASIANTVVWFILRLEWLKLLQGFFTAASCVMGGRLVLNLRTAYYVYSPSNVDFGSSERSLPRGDRMIPLREIRFPNREAERSSSETFEVPLAALGALERISSII